MPTSLKRTMAQQHGFTVELKKQTRDGGRDTIALKTDSLGIPIRLLVECKRFARTNKVGVQVVRAPYGVRLHGGANKSIIVTTSSYTEAAREFVNQCEATKQ
jgi:restriction system protein